MVRRPKIVWSGLDRMDLHRKMIAGDGNCLFASLADQLYGNPVKHPEVRAAIIDHMRNFRPLFENVAIKDDIQQKRATRAAVNAIRNSTSEDGFEDYLTIMSRPGTYGGEPELVAFVQCYDQDVLIHLPRMDNYPETIEYNNQYRAGDAEVKPLLHLCYGGDEKANAHYDSARKNTHVVSPTAAGAQDQTREVSPASSPSSITRPPTARTIRGSRRDVQHDMMHELVLKGSLRHIQDIDRARSPSIDSSQKSTSSKRSIDHDDDDYEFRRMAKFANRLEKSQRKPRLDTSIHNMDTMTSEVKLRSGLATPASTQDSESSSDQSDRRGNTSRSTRRPRRIPVSRALTPDTGSDSSKMSRESPIALKRAISTETMISAVCTDHQPFLQA